MSQIPSDLSRVTQSLGEAISRFERRVAKAATRKVMRRHFGRRTGRRPSPTSHRPARHRAAWPIRYRRSSARTVLGRRRLNDTAGSPNPFLARVRDAAARARDAVRLRLRDLRRALARLRGRATR
jgi:hypothetical protein